MADHEYLGSRTLLAGKIAWNYGQSSIDCVIVNLSDVAARLQVESTRDLPDRFQLVIKDRHETRPCRISWRSENRVGISFEEVSNAPDADAGAAAPRELLRGQLLALRASLDEVEVGVVLLDPDLRAQFINKAFRKMWKLPESKAAARVPFVALMYHGRDTRAYEIAAEELDDYVAARVERVRVGDQSPVDIRLSDGQVVRLNCAPLPNGGRVLTYAPITDIVSQSDRLKALSNALDCVEDGVLLFDKNLRLEFINQKAVRMFSIPEKIAQTGTSLEDVIAHAKLMVQLPEGDTETFAQERISAIRSGASAPADINTVDGKTFRARCTSLASGQRMLTYCDVTDLVRTARRLQVLATTDPMTGLFNRRHFLSVAKTEWNRFQRYMRPLTLVMLDIDNFKMVNDKYGHPSGDEVICAVARACSNDRRVADVVGRLGGEEFAILLPETTHEQAHGVAERIRIAIETDSCSSERGSIRVTASLGVATATLSMSDVSALLRSADKALYQAKARGRNQTALYEASEEDLLRAAQ